MKTSGNTVLITGGSAGIGFEIARLFAENGNKIIITGRDQQRLDKAVSKIKNAHAILSDVSSAADIEKLTVQLQQQFPDLNIVINNAGYASVYKLDSTQGAFKIASDEMLTNYLSVVRLTENLLPLLRKQKEAALVNVSSIVAITPNHGIPTYAASKAALHSYTQSLRVTLERSTSIKVFELMPPLVNTHFSKDIGGANGIAPSVVAEDLLAAIEKDEYEIHVGNTAKIYELYLSSPAEALAAMNG